MKQWEYFTFVIEGEGNKINLSADAKCGDVSLNMLGEQGWEAVSMSYVNNVRPLSCIVLLKREKQHEI